MRHQTTDASSVAEIGAPLLGCDLTTESCRTAMNAIGGSAQNNGSPMRALTDSHGNAIDSVATLNIPAGREIALAGLYSSANKYTTDAWTGAPNTIQLRAPGATSSFKNVTGAVIADVTDNAKRSYYQSFADVTAAVKAGGVGDWAATGAAVAKSATDPTSNYYAGWALVVVYADSVAGGNVTVFDGGAWVATDQSTTFAFAAAENRNAVSYTHLTLPTIYSV